MRHKTSSSTPARNPHWLVRLVMFRWHTAMSRCHYKRYVKHRRESELGLRLGYAEHWEWCDDLNKANWHKSQAEKHNVEVEHE